MYYTVLPRRFARHVEGFQGGLFGGSPVRIDLLGAGSRDRRTEQKDHAREVEEDEQADRRPYRSKDGVVLGHASGVEDEADAQDGPQHGRDERSGNGVAHGERPGGHHAVDDQEREKDQGGRDEHTERREEPADPRERDARGEDVLHELGHEPEGDRGDRHDPGRAEQRQANEALLPEGTARRPGEDAADPSGQRAKDAQRAPDEQDEADDRHAAPSLDGTVDQAGNV